MLIAYTPPGTSGAYAERGPVFVHADPCDGYPTPHLYPPGLSHRQQVVRAYDYHGRIADGVLAADGDHAMDVIHEMLTRPDIALLHLRNVGYGCYNFRGPASLTSAKARRAAYRACPAVTAALIATP